MVCPNHSTSQIADKAPHENFKTSITVSWILAVSSQNSCKYTMFIVQVQCSLYCASLVAGTNIAQIEEVHKVGEIELG